MPYIRTLCSAQGKVTFPAYLGLLQAALTSLLTQSSMEEAMVTDQGELCEGTLLVLT